MSLGPRRVTPLTGAYQACDKSSMTSTNPTTSITHPHRVGVVKTGPRTWAVVADVTKPNSEVVEGGFRRQGEAVAAARRVREAARTAPALDTCSACGEDFDHRQAPTCPASSGQACRDYRAHLARVGA